MIPQDIQADRAIGIDVGVVNLGRETDLGWLERIIGRESDREEENTASVW